MSTYFNHRVFVGDKTIIPLQFQGLGDIIFTQSLLKEYRDMHFHTVWPVKKEFIEGLQFAYPEVTFIPDTMIKPDWFNIKKFEKVDGVYILPIRFAESIMGRPYHMHMKSKYDMCEMDWKDWKTYAYPERNIYKEGELKELLGIDNDEKYNFINTTFSSDANKHIEVEVSNGYKNIHLQIIPGYSLFDWCSVIEHAETIHSVSTSTLYLYELLELNAKEIHLYVRKPDEKDFKYVEFLFTKDYILHL